MKKLLSVMLALAILTSTVSLAHASDSEALNGKSGRWADFDESLYNTVVFVSTVKNADVNGFEWPESGSVLLKVEKKELVRAINSFLDTLSQEKCNIFLCRYWYAIPVSEIATRFGMSEGNVSVTLTRIRIKLKNYLIERGYDL